MFGLRGRVLEYLLMLLQRYRTQNVEYDGKLIINDEQIQILMTWDVTI
jgi:hypothetical protein